MSYEVVARRWRPNTFASVIGQAHVTDTLAGAIAQDRVPHAFLFTGIRGVGKTSIARLLARALNCQNRDGAEPCNECGSCVGALAGSSVDVVEIDAASNTGVDDVRDLIENSQYRPAVGPYKIYIIDEVHQLSKSAFNALLKTLEEPPSHVKFVLATTESHKLPATVLSRCQRYDFRRLTEPEITEQLSHIAAKDSLTIHADALALIAHEADGSMRDAQSLMEQVLAGASEEVGAAEAAELLGVAGQKLVGDCLTSILEGDAAKVVACLDELQRFGGDPEKFLGDLLDLLRHVTVVASAGPGSLSDSMATATQELVGRVAELREPLDLQRVFSSLLGTSSDLRRGIDPYLVLEMGLLKVAVLEPVSSAAEILARLEAGVRGGGAGSSSGGASRSPAAPPSNTRSGGPSRSLPQAKPAPSPAAPAQAPQSAPKPAPATRPPARNVGSAPSDKPKSRFAAAFASASESDDLGEDPDDDRPPIPGDEDAPSPAGRSFDNSAELAQPEASPAPGMQPETRAEPRQAPPSVQVADAAAVPPPVSTGLLTGTKDSHQWEVFLDDARIALEMNLYVALTNCAVTRLDAKHLDLAPLAEGFGRRLDDVGARTKIAELARKHFGADCEVSFGGGAAVEAKPAADDSVTAQKIEDERTRRKHAEAIEDPLVQEAVRNLGGKVAKISVIDD